MKLINKKDNQIIFTAEIEESLLNSIRRYMNEIDLVAIDEVEISKNDSPLYDETIAHRIGLIPLKMEKTIKKSGREELTLNVKKEGFVMSGELQGKLKVIYPNIPITFLNKGSELVVKAITKLGKGSEHSKFSPGLMFYRNLFDVKIDKDCLNGVVNICPKKVFEMQNGKVVVRDSFSCDDCESCIELGLKQGKPEIVKITLNGELYVTLESFGQLSVEDIFEKSIKELKNDLGEFGKQVK